MFQRPTRAVAVLGSPRRRGNCAAVLEATLVELAAQGFDCETIDLRAVRIAPCLGHDDCGDREDCCIGDDAAIALDKVYAADVLVLASPVYYQDVSAQMKAFIDRNFFRYTHDQWLPTRAFGLIAIGEENGLDDTLEAMRRYVVISRKGAKKGEVPVLKLGGYANKAGEAAADEGLMAAARQLGADLAAACQWE